MYVCICVNECICVHVCMREWESVCVCVCVWREEYGRCPLRSLSVVKCSFRSEKKNTKNDKTLLSKYG